MAVCRFAPPGVYVSSNHRNWGKVMLIIFIERYPFVDFIFLKASLILLMVEVYLYLYIETIPDLRYLEQRLRA